MDFKLTEQQVAIDEGVRKVCADFSDQYWTDCETNLHFPEEYYQAMAQGGWLGITMPEEVGGAGLGVMEAAVMMHAATVQQWRLHRRVGHPHQHVRPARRRGARHRCAEAALAASRWWPASRKPASASPSRMPGWTRRA